MRSSRFSISALHAALAAMLLTSACATAPKGPPPEVVWPLPPEKPRIRFVEAISSSQDIEGRRSGRLMELIAGTEAITALNKPYSVHVDAEGRIFVPDTGWRKVLVFDPAGKKFWMLGVDGLGMLAHPLGVSTDREGHIYATDSQQARVVQYDHDGNYMNAFGGREYLVKPVGIAVHDDLQRVYVVDTKANRVSVFGIDGLFIKHFGEHGPQDGAFNWPTNIDIGPDGNIYVMDMLNFRVQVFNPEGEFLWKLGDVGRGFGQFSKPKGVGLNSEGHIYVSDAAFNNVQIFDQQGRLLLFFGGMGSGPGQFWMPAALAIGPDDKIYVADQFNRRINVYEYIRYPEDPVAGGGTAPPPAP